MKENNVIKIKSLAENMLKLSEKNESIYEKISSGYNDLDFFIDSLKKSKLTVIAGRPSSGKSSLIYNLMYNISKQNKKILCFSLDTDIKYVLNSLTAIDSKIPVEKIDSLRFSSDEWEKYTKSVNIVTDFPIVYL